MKGEKYTNKVKRLYICAEYQSIASTVTKIKKKHLFDEDISPLPSAHTVLYNDQ